jgi:hypothetical protein
MVVMVAMVGGWWLCSRCWLDGVRTMHVDSAAQ